MLRFINSFKHSLYSGFRCWFLHCILRQAVDFYDVECINCTMPIGAAETHEPYPMAICTMCQSYTTLKAVIADNENDGVEDSRNTLVEYLAESQRKSMEAVAGMKAYRYIQENTKPKDFIHDSNCPNCQSNIPHSRSEAKGSRVLDDRGTNSEFI